MTVLAEVFNFPDSPVVSVHLSSSSDVYKEGHNYAGFILYSHNGETDWTLNGIHCKSGYMVILDSDSYRVSSLKGNSPGQIHGAVYKCIFGEDPNGATKGEGFAYYRGDFRWSSGVFNGLSSLFFGNRKSDGRDYIYSVLKLWMNSGTENDCLPSGQNCTLTCYSDSTPKFELSSYFTGSRVPVATVNDAINSGCTIQ